MVTNELFEIHHVLWKVLENYPKTRLRKYNPFKRNKGYNHSEPSAAVSILINI